MRPRADHREMPPAAERPTSLLDTIEMARELTHVTASAHRYGLRSDGDRDHLTITSPSGEVVLRLELGRGGPVLRFESADIELSASKRLALSAPEVTIAAAEHVGIESGGTMTSHVKGTRHARVDGVDRLEAAAIERQASDGAVVVRALGRIALDGQHIGLNDEPCPEPFSWSEAKKQEAR